MTMLEVRPIDVATIRPGNNDRTDFDRGELERLAASIATDGLLQPITVRPLDDGTYEIVAGERRFRAITEVLAWQTVDAIVRSLDDDQASRAMAVENLVRVDLDPIAEARAYRARMGRHGLDAAGVAQWCGVSVRRVRERLELLACCPEVAELVRCGQLPIGHARTAARLPADFQVLAVKAYGERGLAFGPFQALCDELAAKASEVSMFDAEAFWTVVDDTVAADKRRKVDVRADDLMDGDEIARLIGVTARQFANMRQRPSVYRKLDGLPKPLRMIAGRPIWLSADIRGWIDGDGARSLHACASCGHAERDHDTDAGAHYCRAPGCTCFTRRA